VLIQDRGHADEGRGPWLVRADHRWALAAGALLCAASLGAYLVAAAAHSASFWFMGDLEIYRWGGLLARRSGPLYSAAFGPHHLPFTYPPAAALAFVVLTSLPLAALKVIITVASLLSLAAAAWLALGAEGIRAPAVRAGAALTVTAITLWTDPVQQTLSFGQVNLLLMAIVLGDLCQRDDRWWKGAGVGLAAAIKLTPAIFIVYLLVTRRLRAAATATAVLCLTIAAGFALLPRQSRRYWLSGLFLSSTRGTPAYYVGNQSLQGVMARLAGGVTAARAPWLAAEVAVGVAGILIAAMAHRRGRELAGVVACAVTGLLVSPITWDHHWVWIVPLLVVAVGLLRRHRHALGWACVIILTAVFLVYPLPYYRGGPVAPKGLIWTAPFGGQRNFDWHGVQLLAGNLYAVAGLSVLAAMALLIAVSRPAARSRPRADDVPGPAAVLAPVDMP
jgi:alpha-1,2-mannosyltransferase